MANADYVNPAQDSLREQIVRVLTLATNHGEYDAADFISRAFFGENVSGATEQAQAAERRWRESKPEHRCYHEDDRGRCRRYDTEAYRWTTPGGRAAVDYYCPTHMTRLHG